MRFHSANTATSIVQKYLSILCLLLIGCKAMAQSERRILDFEFEGVQLNGILNIPESKSPRGIVLLVHGSGRTDAIAQELHLDVRQAILKAGYATYMWDKMGCGKSGGTFDYNQSVQNSALEVIAAINTLKNKNIAGSQEIGLWGISRAGWINPIVINQYKDIKFWISVSGVDDKENFNYLLEQNLEINGTPKDSIRLLSNELKAGARLSHSGASFETYMNATKNLRNNTFFKRFRNNTTITAPDYYAYQKTFMQETLDEASGLQIYIQDFEALLSNIKCPVLALFGEKDRNVDWKKTKALYARTLAKNTALSIQSFPDCNHNLFRCKTGGFYEFQDNALPWIRSPGFLEAITDWLNEIGP
ncbi:alpha/beta hydrolase family protein [Spongiimicrobium salis]|uniref:alpha/beta hydrolase family protein n=1 Tax=Spongiimicrobium salis TaxID=1667022 RepID=UPI00374C912E